MKKLLSAVLALVLALGIFSVAAAAASSDNLDDIFPENRVVVYKGFNKKNADYFVKKNANNPGLTFSVEPNPMFIIDEYTGKLTFMTGFSSNVHGPVDVTARLNGESKVIQVRAQYEPYEYFVIIFAAGLFWISAVNNG